MGELTALAVLFVMIGGFGILSAGFYFLDRWHRRYAWRKAEQEAAKYMNQRYGPPGVENYISDKASPPLAPHDRDFKRGW